MILSAGSFTLKNKRHVVSFEVLVKFKASTFYVRQIQSHHCQCRELVVVYFVLLNRVLVAIFVNDVHKLIWRADLARLLHLHLFLVYQLLVPFKHVADPLVIEHVVERKSVDSFFGRKGVFEAVELPFGQPGDSEFLFEFLFFLDKQIAVFLVQSTVEVWLYLIVDYFHFVSQLL